MVIGDRVGASSDQRANRTLAQGAEASGGEIAGDAADAEAIGAVGRDRDVEHRILEPGISGIALADRRFGGKLDDPVVPGAELQLALGAHHAVGSRRPRIAATLSVKSLPGT